ncbi:MAG: hypothetical protein HY718_14345, partial [Planctomycetes bacterium]|nr:hypothetical protein [Planctomycetota bacterium]
MTALFTSYYCTNTVNQYTATDNDHPDCPSPTESFSYDNDGNLTADGTYTYEWDGENRLVKVQTRLDLGNDPDDPDENDKKLEFKYDYLGRRVEKKYSVYTSGNWAVQTGGWQRFVYDDWNVALVLSAADSNAVVKKYTWGLDLSGQSGSGRTVDGLHGAGGIGGLLAAVETGGTYAGTYWFLYDGNGNVGQVLDAT